MGKLTYVNRKIEGDKLVAVVTRDIAKRIPPNLSFKVALRDPIVDFDISSKLVGDKGLEKVSQELVKAINHRDPGRVMILEEVCLKGNMLSVQGLASFVSVIQASSSEIRILDLSSNAIEITKPQDAVAWETFLQSLSQCTALHRLDLSGNKLGQKGFELLLKTYAFEKGLVEGGEIDKAQFGGLRSIPYICLSDTGLDDICAMHLSYILENHGFVEQLLPMLPQPKPGSQTHQLEAYDEAEGCNGIIWKPNPEVQDLGTRVLEAAEALRKSRDDLQDQDTIDAQLIESFDEIALSNSPRSPSEARSRGDSLVSLDDSFQSNSSTTTCDLTRARSRIMLDALKVRGLQQNDLWMAAFKIFQHTRAILFGYDFGVTTLTKSKRKASHDINNKESSQAFPPLPSRTEPIMTRPKATETGAPLRSALSKTSSNIFNPAKVFLNRNEMEESIQKLFYTSDKPKTHKVYDNLLRLTPETRRQYLGEYRYNFPYGLSEDLWIKIIAYASDGEGILSENQRITAVRWAASRHSIMELRSVMGKHVSQQIYKALEGLNCLTYDI